MVSKDKIEELLGALVGVEIQPSDKNLTDIVLARQATAISMLVALMGR